LTRRYAAIAVGGALGASVRWWVANHLGTDAAFPWATLAVNVAGCAILGLLLAEEWTHRRQRLLLHDAGGIGFCGGVTTFSTFAVETVHLADGGRGSTAALYLAASLVTGLAAFVAAGAALRRVRALAVPLGESP